MATVRGLEQLKARFNRMSRPQTIERGLSKSALKMERTAKILATESSDTGYLRASIFSEVENERIILTAGAFYAPFVEFGTGIFSSTGDGRQTPWTYQDPDTQQWYTTRGMHPQPFMYPALEAHRNDILNDVRRAIMGAR